MFFDEYFDRHHFSHSIFRMCSVSAICLSVVVGYAYGKAVNTELPIYEDLAVYPEFTLDELVDASDVIVDGVVIEWEEK